MRESRPPFFFPQPATCSHATRPRATIILRPRRHPSFTPLCLPLDSRLPLNSFFHLLALLPPRARPRHAEQTTLVVPPHDSQRASWYPEVLSRPIPSPTLLGLLSAHTGGCKSPLSQNHPVLIATALNFQSSPNARPTPSSLSLTPSVPRLGTKRPARPQLPSTTPRSAPTYVLPL